MNRSLPDCRRVKFGEVVKLVKERSSNPVGDGIERYVGLEHIEPEDLRVRSWGNVVDGTTFTSRFRPGQVLFGKRRAYQRKVAVADFNGVCSGDIYVFESNDPSALLPEWLPFLCRTDAFFQHAVGTSAGSLSPRTNWSSLAEFEVTLPSLHDQRHLTRALRAAVEVSYALEASAEHAQTAESALLEEFIKCSRKWCSIGEILLDISYGCSQRSSIQKVGIPILRIPNVLRGGLDFSDLQWIELSDADRNKFGVVSVKLIAPLVPLTFE